MKLSDYVSAGNDDLLSELTESEVTINGTASLDSTAYGKFHKVTDDGGSTQYTITLPDPSGNAGKFIGFYGDTSSNLTRFVKLNPNASETVRGLSFDCIHNDKVLVLKSDGTNWQAIVLINTLTANEELNFDNSMTSVTMNSWFDALPKITNGNSITVQFADGSYSLDTLYVSGFEDIRLVGNSSDNSLSTSKSVDLDFSGSDQNGVYCQNCTYLLVRYLDISIDSSSNHRRDINASKCLRVDTRYNYIHGNSTAYGHGICYGSGSGFYCGYNYVSNVEYSISATYGADFLSQGNDDTGTQPAYGLFANAGTIRKSGIQPSGSSANEQTSSGGDIL